MSEETYFPLKAHNLDHILNDIAEEPVKNTFIYFGKIFTADVRLAKQIISNLAQQLQMQSQSFGANLRKSKTQKLANDILDQLDDLEDMASNAINLIERITNQSVPTPIMYPRTKSGMMALEMLQDSYATAKQLPAQIGEIRSFALSQGGRPKHQRQGKSFKARPAI